MQDKTDGRDTGGGGPVRQAVPPLLVVLVALGAAIALPRLGLGLPPLFGPEQEIVHAAVIVGLSILGAALLAVGFVQIALARRDLGAIDEDLAAADAEEAQARAGLERVDRLLESLRAKGAGRSRRA